MGSVEKKMPRINERLATSGFRFTPQRQHVYGVLLGERDHPTAEQVFLRAKKDLFRGRMIAFPEQHAVNVLSLRGKTKPTRGEPLVDAGHFLLDRTHNAGNLTTRFPFSILGIILILN